VVPDFVDEAERVVLELDELEVVDVVVGMGFWLVVGGSGRGVLVVCGVVEGGVEEVEGAILYQENMKNNFKRNTHKSLTKTKAGGPALRCCWEKEEGLGGRRCHCRCLFPGDRRACDEGYVVQYS
jgi:hypothetical protein